MVRNCPSTGPSGHWVRPSGNRVMSLSTKLSNSAGVTAPPSVCWSRSRARPVVQVGGGLRARRGTASKAPDATPAPLRRHPAARPPRSLPHDILVLRTMSGFPLDGPTTTRVKRTPPKIPQNSVNNRGHSSERSITRKGNTAQRRLMLDRSPTSGGGTDPREARVQVRLVGRDARSR